MPSGHGSDGPPPWAQCIGASKSATAVAVASICTTIYRVPACPGTFRLRRPLISWVNCDLGHIRSGAAALSVAAWAAGGAAGTHDAVSSGFSPSCWRPWSSWRPTARCARAPPTRARGTPVPARKPRPPPAGDRAAVPGLLPNIQVQPAANLVIDTTGPGRLLRFDSTLVNTGPGPLEVVPQPAGPLPGAAAARRAGDLPGRRRRRPVRPRGRPREDRRRVRLHALPPRPRPLARRRHRCLRAHPDDVRRAAGAARARSASACATATACAPATAAVGTTASARGTAGRASRSPGPTCTTTPWTARPCGCRRPSGTATTACACRPTRSTCSARATRTTTTPRSSSGCAATP